MSIVNTILDSYKGFFSIHEFIKELSNFQNLTVIFTLVIMEGLLSADNALVLAMMVKHLPADKQKRALSYGIVGAYFFRFLAIGVGTMLIKIWWVKLIAAAYLIKMSLDFFFKKKEEDDVKVINKGFWATVVSIELMDIAFSIDSITSAIGISNKVWVLFLGAILGIAMMRGVAKIFVSLIEKIPELENGAYILILLIGIKMVLQLVHIEIPENIFFLALLSVFGVIIVRYFIKKRKLV